MMRTSLNKLVVVGFTALVIACSLIESHPVLPVDAEIRSITYHSDTSVNVVVDVYKNSTAWSCSFNVRVSLYDSPNPPSNQYILITRECDLEEHYELIVGGLDNTERYSFQLQSKGTYDIGGPNQPGDFDVGEPRIFTFPK